MVSKPCGHRIQDEERRREGSKEVAIITRVTVCQTHSHMQADTRIHARRLAVFLVLLPVAWTAGRSCFLAVDARSAYLMTVGAGTTVRDVRSLPFSLSPPPSLPSTCSTFSREMLPDNRCTRMNDLQCVIAAATSLVDEITCGKGLNQRTT